MYSGGLDDVEATLGSHVSDDAKYFIVDPTCASGAPFYVTSIATQTPDGAAVTLTRVDSTRVEGTVSVTFDDGSSFAGRFSLSVCDAMLDEKSVCE